MSGTGLIDQEARDMARTAISRSDSHEILCTERWDQQHKSMTRVETALGEIQVSITRRIGMVPAGVISGLMALCGFLAARAFPIH